MYQSVVVEEIIKDYIFNLRSVINKSISSQSYLLTEILQLSRDNDPRYNVLLARLMRLMLSPEQSSN